MLELNAEGTPLTSAMTTQRFMMTPALMELYAFLDAWQVGDTGISDRSLEGWRTQAHLHAGGNRRSIPITETLDPASPNYMHWFDPDVATVGTTQGAVRRGSHRVSRERDRAPLPPRGAIPPYTTAAGAKCVQYGGSAKAPQLTTADFGFSAGGRPSAPAGRREAPTAFYDLATLRSATELVLTNPRVGFFSTPAFFANWQTNTSNMARVTTNQSLIVATGAAVDGTDTTVPPTTPGLDAAHAAPGSACFQCHQLLDPTRSILAATYSWNYHQQDETAFSTQPGLFAFEGVIKPVSTIADYGAVLATHPLFAQAWVQKLAYYVNSTACDTTDPEFQRIVGVFQSSNYSWTALVRELLSSPLTTYVTPTKTTLEVGETVAVSRRESPLRRAQRPPRAHRHLRAGRADPQGAADGRTRDRLRPPLGRLWPRRHRAGVLPNQPTLFYRAGTENICEAVAPWSTWPSPWPGVTQWTSTQPAAEAIADFVSIMGLTPSDPRAARAQTILTAHYAQAVQSGATASNALKSTFIAACAGPSAISIGL